MKHIFYISFVLLFFPFTFVLGQQNPAISLEDIWLKGTYQPNYLYGLNWMKNSDYYTALSYNRETEKVDIIQFETKTGNSIKTLLKGSDLVLPNGSIVDIEDYQLSSDEKQLLVGTAIEPVYRRSSLGIYYLYNLGTQEITAISTEKILNPAFAPDNSKLAYVKDNDLYYFDLKLLSEVRVTFDGMKNSIINGAADWVYEEEFEFTKAFFWSPDSKFLAFYRFDESEVKEYSMQVWGDLYPVDYKFKYPKAGEKNAVVQIKVFNLQNKKTTNLDLGSETDQYIPRVMWTQSSNIVSVQRLNRLQNHFEIIHYNAHTGGKGDVVYEEKNNTYIEIRDDLTYLKNGSHFIITSEKSGFRHFYKVDLASKQVKPLTKGGFECNELVGLDEEKNLLYFLSNESSVLEQQLYSLSLDGKQKKQLTSRKGFHEVELSQDKNFFIDYYTTSDSPYSISVHALPSGAKVKQLVDNASLVEKLSGLRLSQTEFIKIETSNKITLNGYIIKPKNFDSKKKYPVLVTVYGGPGYQTVLNKWGGANYLWYQMLAENGIVVVGVDNRGTGGRGEKFKKETYGNLGKLETEDIIEVAKYLGKIDYIDQSRIGIFGWSFGGYLSSLAITLGADVYKLAIAVAPVTSWRFYDTIYTERFLGLPENNPSGYDDNSPISHADKLKGKYLLIHGTADDNVHVQNAVEMQRALIEANKQFDVFYYPDKNHSIFGGVTRYHLYKKMTDYLLNNL
jgi:dipeptidyl-peptidase-4